MLIFVILNRDQITFKTKTIPEPNEAKKKKNN